MAHACQKDPIYTQTRQINYYYKAHVLIYYFSVVNFNIDFSPYVQHFLVFTTIFYKIEKSFINW
jgi:hypothetical protein